MNAAAAEVPSSTYTVQGPSQEWCHPQWVGVPTSVKTIKIIPGGP